MGWPRDEGKNARDYTSFDCFTGGVQIFGACPGVPCRYTLFMYSKIDKLIYILHTFSWSIGCGLSRVVGIGGLNFVYAYNFCFANTRAVPVAVSPERFHEF